MENKDDILKGLYGIKEELSKEIFELENKLYLTRCSLDDINDEICKIGGHCFGDWNKLLILIGLMMKMVIKYIVIREYAVFVVEKKLLLI